MGWTYSDSWGSASAMRDYLRGSLTSAGNEIVKDALVGYGHRYYAAIKGKDGHTGIFVALINGSRANGYGYKDMDESMGPCEHDCPLSVLDAASPIEDLYGPVKEDGGAKWATDWRAKVRAYHAKRAEGRATAKTLKRGDKVWIKNARGNPFTIVSIGAATKKIYGDVSGVPLHGPSPQGPHRAGGGGYRLTFEPTGGTILVGGNAMRPYGNLMNRISEHSLSPTPEIGMGATVYMWSDRHCGDGHGHQQERQAHHPDGGPGDQVGELLRHGLRAGPERGDLRGAADEERHVEVGRQRRHARQPSGLPRPELLT